MMQKYVIKHWKNLKMKITITKFQLEFSWKYFRMIQKIKDSELSFISRLTLSCCISFQNIEWFGCDVYSTCQILRVEIDFSNYFWKPVVQAQLQKSSASIHILYLGKNISGSFSCFDPINSQQLTCQKRWSGTPRKSFVITSNWSTQDHLCQEEAQQESTPHGSEDSKNALAWQCVTGQKLPQTSNSNTISTGCIGCIRINPNTKIE